MRREGHTAAELTAAELERVFRGARAARPMPSEDFLARVMQGALEAMPVAAANAPLRVEGPLRKGGMAGLLAGMSRGWASLSAGFGGGGVVASLGAVAMIAVILGYSAPAGLAEGLLPLSAASDGADGGVEIEPVAIYFLAGG